MSNLNNEVIQNMQSVDRAYGDVAGKRIIHKDKSNKHPQQFNRMSVQDVLSMQEDGDYDDEDEYDVD